MAAIAVLAEIALTRPVSESTVYPFIAAEDILSGAPIVFNASGLGVNADEASDDHAVGLSLRLVKAGATGSYVKRGRVGNFDLSGLAYGDQVFLGSDVVDDTAGSTNAVPVGRVVPMTDAPTMTKVLEVEL